jgi:hypothetical protein
VEGAEAHTDHPAAAPPDHPRHRPHVPQQAPSPRALEPASRGWDPAEPLLPPQQQMMGQAGQQEPQGLRCPLALPAGDQAPCLFVLTEARFHPGPPVVGVGASARGEVGHRRHPYRLWVAPLVLGRPHAPLPRRATATVGLQDGGDLAAGARRRRPGPQGLTALPPPATGAALGDDLRVSTAYPVQDRRGAPTLGSGPL